MIKIEQSPLVSIIIPTYNDGHVVCDAIDCSLNQTYDHIEIIVIDDGSTDGTDRLLRKKYGNRIKYIYQKNRGLSNARNTGIKYAAGKYLQFLDADDLIDKDKISIQMGRLQDITDMALAYCDYIRTPLDHVDIKCRERMSPILRSEAPFNELMMKWETELSIPPHCFIFDSSIFREHRILFDDDLPNHEDWECWMNVFALNPKVVFIEQPLANYRIRRDSMCHDRVKMRNGYLMAIDKQISKYQANREIVKKLQMRKKQIKYLYMDVSPMIRAIERCHPIIKKVYLKFIPSRIQRMFV